MMKRINKLAAMFVLLASGLAPAIATAENSYEAGDYVVHYNAFRSDTLSPEIAKNYQLKRRNNQIVVNIAVLKKVMNTPGTPVHAKVSGHASNLSGQLKGLEFREIKEGSAIYYLSQSKFTDRELLKFEIKVEPADSEVIARIKFSQRFYTSD